jgi:hypothetical protein
VPKRHVSGAVYGAANGSFEPTVTAAARCSNVRFSVGDQKRDETKGHFANGLWHRIFQEFLVISPLLITTTDLAEALLVDLILWLTGSRYL